MRSIFSYVMVLLSAMALLTSPTSAQEFSFSHDQKLVQFYLDGIRGFWYGFYRGFFHEMRKPHEKCLADSAADEIETVLQFLAYGEFSDIFTVADSITTLYYDNKQFCGEMEIFQSLMGKCYGHQAEACKFMTFVKNIFVKHLIEAFGCLSVITDTLIKFRINIDGDFFREEMGAIGKNIGLLLALFFDV